jgi:hypothetical protein
MRRDIKKNRAKRIKRILLNFPVVVILIVVNIILVGWLIHILHVIFTDALDHMSLYEWTEHLYILAKNTFEELFESINLPISL